MLSKQYDPKETEPALQRFWQQEGIYRFVPDGREVFSIDTPPPTISGSLHIGHVFSYTQAEIIARFQRMQGKNVFYPFGFDDNGLPSERLTEKEHGVRAADLPRGEFIRLCRETTAKYIGEFRALWQAMGFSVDWSLQYDTIGERAQKTSQRSFIRLAREGHAYRKDAPVLWCPCCRTSIAQAELETKELASAYHTVPFLVEGKTVPVATTRPELLYGCVALFVHPEDERYRGIVGKRALVPFYHFEVPVLADDAADPGKGTGAVLCATYGDTTDLSWVQKHGLPYKRVLEPDGRISPDVPELGGLPAPEARQKMAALLRENGLLLGYEPIRHTVSVHERCGHEVEILPSSQWFIDVLSQKERLLAAADEIRWHPASMKTRYRIWVENLKWDWCVSRQRYFGVPLPVWYCKACGAPAFAAEEQLPVHPTESRPPHPCACGCDEWLPETAVMDTWATSSLTPFINAKSGEPGELPLLPMSMRSQAHEIIRTWAFYTIARSLYETGGLPWKDIMICGFVLAKKGEKISKSKGNAVDSPLELVHETSADALRYWAAGAHLGTDTLFSRQDLSQSGRFLTKFWNAARFTLAMLEDFDGKRPAELLPADAWLLERCAQAQAAAADALGEYDTGAARAEIDRLFWEDYCDSYLELAKERLYGTEDAAGRRAAQYALRTAFFAILQFYAPFVPHITEAVYQQGFRQYGGAVSLHTVVWPERRAADERLLRFGEALKAVLSAFRRYRSERRLPRKTPLARAYLTAPAELLPLFSRAGADIRKCCMCEELVLEAGEEVSVRIEAGVPGEPG